MLEDAPDDGGFGEEGPCARRPAGDRGAFAPPRKAGLHPALASEILLPDDT